MKSCWNCGDSIPDDAAVCETCGAEQPATGNAATGSSLKAGDVLAGRYEIRGEIGEGAVGRVFRAQDREVDVAVALRVVHPDWVSDEQSRKQFKASVRRSRDILHSGCVKLYEADVENGMAFLTMEFIGGLSLRRVLAVRQNERRPFRPNEVEPILAQIVSALEAGHSKGVPHLSLSPANVLIQPEGLKLTDFGLASLIPAAKRRSTAEKYKAIPYCSPQYLNGDSPAASDDTYSLGAILFEMVTLQTPAPGLSPGDVTEDVPEELEDLIADCLSEKPGSRPKSAGEVLSRWKEAVAKEAPKAEAAPPAPASPPRAARAEPPPPPPPPPMKPVEAEPPPPPPPPKAARAEPPPPPEPVAPPPPKPEPERPASLPTAESWSPPPAKKGPPVGLILAAVILLAGVGGYFALGGGSDEEPKSPVSAISSTPEKPAAETAKPAPPPEPVTVKAEEPEKTPAPAAAVSITREEKPVVAAPKETKPAEAVRPVTPPPAPAKTEPPKPVVKEEKPKAVASAEPTPSVGNCPSGMVFVKGGSFKMGSSPDDSARDFAEKPLTPTGVPDFCIDRFESPNEEGAQPRANVSWTDAKAACESAGKRLCSEAEWEKACKGPKETRYPYGDLFNARSCNTRDQSGADRPLAPAGKHNQCTNSYGAFDMSGNLREWTSTAWSESSSDKVVRGGSHSRPDWATRCAFRENFQPATKDSQIGFRCCK